MTSGTAGPHPIFASNDKMPSTGAEALVAASPCQACGACCCHSREWPRFTLESDAEIDRIPARLVTANQSGMKCDGDRCTALVGEIATWTSCTIYDVRPIVCRECVAGDDACTLARERVGLPPLRQD